MFNPIANHRGFGIACLNIASLPKHIDELKLFMSDQVLDILAINESRLDESIPDSMVDIPGYQILRKDRNRNGGGVVLYIRCSINYIERKDLFHETLETICIEIHKFKSKPFLVATWYRPPSAPTSIFDLFEDALKKIDSGGIEFHLLGDLNCNLKAQTMTENYSTKLKDLCQVYQLTQTIHEFTRVTPVSSSLIDVHLTNDPTKISTSGVIHVGISDHSLIYTIRKIGIPKGPPKIIKTRNYKSFSSQLFLEDLSNQPWEILNNLSDPNEIWSNFKAIFLTIFDKHAPIINRKIRNKPSPWITQELKSTMYKRDYHKRKATKPSGTQEDWSEYRKIRNLLNKNIKSRKEEYYRNTIKANSDNPKDMWKTLKELISVKTKSSNISQLKMGDTIISDPQRIAEEMNSYFVQIGPHLSDKIPKSSTSSSHYFEEKNCKFSFTKISERKVYDLLSSLSTAKATGLDGISSKILKIAAPVITSTLTFLFNKSIETSVFPDDWKGARVSPIFKAGDRDNIDNYRPISVLSAVTKIFEKVVFDQLYSYVSRNKLLYKYQSGFRSVYSTVTALLDATNEWYTNMDNGLYNGVVFLDLKKAFDTIDHKILLEKLNLYGIQGKPLDWFQSYISNRFQICSINGALSDKQTVTCGVPQGSTLGPLLFLLYINDLPNALEHSKARMYADDTTMTASGESISEVEELLNSDLEKAKDWFITNKLSLNTSKCEYMVVASNYRIHNTDHVPQISIGQLPIKRVSKSKSLGVHIDEELSWHEHINEICKKVSRGLAVLKRIKPYVTRDCLVLVYNAVVQSQLDYCSIVWDSIGTTLANKLQKLQNRAARIITDFSYDIRSAQILHHLEWVNLESRRKALKSVLMYKIANNLCPDYLADMFNPVSNATHYGLRSVSSQCFQIPRAKTNFGKNAFSYSGATLWNNIDPNIKLNTQSVSSFKDYIKNNNPFH